MAVRTDTGRVRSHNEDSSLLLQLELFAQPEAAPALLGAVADGMGGHTNGQLASKMALRALAASVVQGLNRAPLEGPQALTQEQAVNLLAEAVQASAAQLAEAERHGLVDMGTTLCAALLLGRRAFIANLGDSRAYLYDGELQQITEDHSVVAQLVARGELTPEEARSHPRRNEIYRMLGFGRITRPDLFVLDLEPGDLLLLCSDGLTGHVTDAELASLLSAGRPLEETAAELVASANQAGGEDNITALLIRVMP